MQAARADRTAICLYGGKPGTAYQKAPTDLRSGSGLPEFRDHRPGSSVSREFLGPSTDLKATLHDQSLVDMSSFAVNIHTMNREPTGAIAREIKQGKPFRSLSMEAVLTLLRTADVIHRHFERVVLPRGVTIQQYNVLRILRGAGERGLPTLEIAKRMVEKAPGVTRLIDRMAAKGWVDRVRCTEDRRVVYCRITDAGLALVSQLDEPMAAADDAALSMLHERDQRQLIRLLDAIRAGHRELLEVV